MPRRKNSDISEIHEFGVDVNSREIFLHPNLEATEDSGVDFAMSSYFIKNVRMLDVRSNDPILIHMNTGGGYIAYGMSIYDAIKACSAYITILAYGYASSMSSIILQAADRRVCMPNVEFMIHEGAFSLNDSCRANYSYVEWSKHQLNVMITLYMEKCAKGPYFLDKKPSQIKSFIKHKFSQKQDWYMTADESLYYGLCDGILGTKGYETIDAIKIYK